MFCPECGHSNVSDARQCAQCGKPMPGDTANPYTPPTALSEDYASLRVDGVYAGFWRRFAAVMLDSILIWILTFALGSVLGVSPLKPNVSGPHFGLYQILSLATNFLYFTLMESSAKQATLGKMALGIKVVDTEGHRISFGRAAGRYFGKILSSITLCIGYLMAAFTERRQALHDKLAGTLVVARDTVPEDVQGGKIAKPMSGGSTVLIVLGALAIPIIGILAAIALPAYQDYTVRARMTGVAAMAREVTDGVTAYVVRNGALPASFEDLHINNTSPDVQHIAVDAQTGEVSLTVGMQPIAGQTLVMTPRISADGRSIASWECSSPDIKPLYLPKECR